jgi:predicted O-methyltransferase YrrM
MRERWRFEAAPFEADAHNPLIPVSPWAGHRRFAYDYVRNILPRTVVELGTYHGCAFFAFCQAAKDGGMDWMSLHAVDSWTGNAHDGFYGDEVFERFKAIAGTCFGGLRITPVRKLFLDAAPDFEDESIDLLHIDGTHTYGALSEDLETWLPKLAPEGVIFLHDVHTERHATTRLWRELSLLYPTLLFEHSFGLGLLFPKGDRQYRHLVNCGLDKLAPFYSRMGALEVELGRTRLESESAFANGFAAGIAEAHPQYADIEQRLRAAREELAREKAQTAVWWQAAMDAQWKVDCLTGDANPKK